MPEIPVPPPAPSPPVARNGAAHTDEKQGDPKVATVLAWPIQIVCVCAQDRRPGTHQKQDQPTAAAAAAAAALQLAMPTVLPCLPRLSPKSHSPRLPRTRQNQLASFPWPPRPCKTCTILGRTREHCYQQRCHAQRQSFRAGPELHSSVTTRDTPGYHAKQTETRRNCVQLTSAQHNRIGTQRMHAQNGDFPSSTAVCLDLTIPTTQVTGIARHHSNGKLVPPK